MLTAADIQGVCAMIPTPCKEGADRWDATDSVDLDETARMVENLIRDGIGLIAACGSITACWSTSACMGPEPIIALMEAMRRNDESAADAIWEDIQSVPSMIPRGEFPHFPEYNAQAEKARFNAAGYVKAGPSRAPYQDLPEQWRQQAEAHGKTWAELRKKYARG